MSSATFHNRAGGKAMLWPKTWEQPRRPKAPRRTRLIGAAIGCGAREPGCEHGPDALGNGGVLARVQRAHPALSALDVVRVPPSEADPLAQATAFTCALATRVREVIARGERVCVLGGDHSCAIGTWSGARLALAEHETLGLLWIDAHMDCHTPETSPSGALHGMPLACLLGEGPSALVELGGVAPKLRGHTVCIAGVRSYEPAEDVRLRSHGVRVYSIHEVRRRGLPAVFHEALARVRAASTRFGLSIDLDAIDPNDAPAVSTPAAGGIAGMALVAALRAVAGDPRFLGVEIAEFNPAKDLNGMTAELIGKLVGAVTGGVS